MNVFKQLEKSDRIYFLLALLFLIVLYEINISDVKVPTIVHDEIGYWANAAYYAGYDWSSTLEYMPYYGYGAGLILSLFMRIFQDPLIVYQAVMQFFVLLLGLSYCMAYKIADDLFPDVSKTLKILACMAAVCYPSYFMNARIAWSEHFLFFFTWINIFLFHSYMKKPNTIKIMLCAVCLVYLYMLHQRTIGMVILAFFYIVYLRVKKKVKRSDFVIFAICMLAMLLLHEYLKTDIQQNLWFKRQDAAVAVEDNDYRNRIESFFLTLNAYGIQSMLISFIGKSFYIVVGSLGILIEGIFGLFYCKKMNDSKNICTTDYTIIYIYVLVAGAVGLNVIATMGMKRVDGLIYGRYMEHAFSPVIMIGMCSLFKRDIGYKHIARVDCFILALSLIVYYIYKGLDLEEYFGVCAGSTLWSYENVGEFEFVIFCGLITTFVYTMICLCRNNNKIKYLAAIIIIILFSVNGIYLRNEMGHIEDNNESMIGLANKISNIGIEANIYVVRGELPHAYMYMEVLQYLLPDYKMVFLEEEDLKTLSGEYYLMVEESRAEYNMGREYIGSEYNGWQVYIPQNSELQKKIEKAGF